MPTLRACLLNCSLKPSGPSSTQVLLDEVAVELRAQGVEIGKAVRVAAHDVRPGVTSDEGDGDAWPAIRRQVLDAQILVFGTPIWLGHPSSVAQRVLERMDAFLGETDDRGQVAAVDRVAMVAVVGNEDGAHHVSAELFQGLSDVGFTIPANGVTYWVGQAMQGVDYQDLEERPEETAAATKLAVANTVHLARLLAGSRYPSVG